MDQKMYSFQLTFHLTCQPIRLEHAIWNPFIGGRNRGSSKSSSVRIQLSILSVIENLQPHNTRDRGCRGKLTVSVAHIGIVLNAVALGAAPVTSRRSFAAWRAAAYETTSCRTGVFASSHDDVALFRREGGEAERLRSGQVVGAMAVDDALSQVKNRRLRKSQVAMRGAILLQAVERLARHMLAVDVLVQNVDTLGTSEDGRKDGETKSGKLHGS